jgi:hypothetical protein
VDKHSSLFWHISSDEKELRLTLCVKHFFLSPIMRPNKLYRLSMVASKTEKVSQGQMLKLILTHCQWWKNVLWQWHLVSMLQKLFLHHQWGCKISNIACRWYPVRLKRIASDKWSSLFWHIGSDKKEFYDIDTICQTFFIVTNNESK